MRLQPITLRFEAQATDQLRPVMMSVVPGLIIALAMGTSVVMLANAPPYVVPAFAVIAMAPLVRLLRIAMVKGAQRQIEMGLAESGFSLTTIAGASKYPWPRVTGYREEKGGFVIDIDRRPYFLPKRAIADVELVRAWLSAKSKKRR